MSELVIQRENKTHTLHSLFQQDDIVGRSLSETSTTKKQSLTVFTILITPLMVDC